MAAQIRLQYGKAKVLEVGKAAQKTKEEAKTVFDNDGCKPDDQDLYQWVTLNYPKPQCQYNEYASAAAAYMAALQEVDPSAAKERQEAQNKDLGPLLGSEHAFERNFYINLPEE
ncbi:uncharacterized protein FIESC28_08728 [Fusarium coffeatum]|uniref:Uncharacterized protein n=1 Tax=Fusarium coffeatum TaxID=231269 RepID=A0A366R5Q8_9HYPO|nr:uncharacterized protein FIESC28_08728 [Fusarium coffeatum]RBR12242.1 hypothetical protein FIESC28_08728 [Fusarium coffeatum]